MILIRTQYEDAATAQAMLASFKQWARIDHADDDVQLELVLRRAMASLERQLGISIVSAEWEFVPFTDTLQDTSPPYVPQGCGCEPVTLRPASQVVVPVLGVSSFTASDVGGGDVTADFTLVHPYQDMVTGRARLIAKTGTIPADTKFILVVGATADMPAEVIDVVYRFALYLWENRESATDRAMSEVPDWLNRSWGTLWVPRV